MDTNVLTNKLLSIIIALVVTCLVLVPLCNIGGGGDDGPKYHNIGTHMREVDLTVPAVYEWDASENYDEHTLLVMWYLSLEEWEFDPPQGYSWEPNENPDNPIKTISPWGINETNTHITITVDGEGEFIVEEGDGSYWAYDTDGAKLWVYDKSGSYYSTFIDSWGDVAPVYDIRIPATTQYDLYLYITNESASGSVGYEGYYHLLNGQLSIDFESTWNYNDVIINRPEISLDESGKIEVIGNIQISNYGNNYTLSPNVVSAFGFIPEYTPLMDESGTPAESSLSTYTPSTTNTLVRFVPIFVILGILGAVATSLFSRKESLIG